MTRDEFLRQIPENNTEFVSQILLNNCTNKDIKQFAEIFSRFKHLLFKSYLREEMSFNELLEAIEIADDLKNK